MRYAVVGALLGCLAVGLAVLRGDSSAGRDAELPATLAATGLYLDADGTTVAPSNRPFSPQYPLWSDGAGKRRWIHLPPGSAIDGRDADAWQFPVGTRLWKEFAFGRRVETRYMERAATGWRFATYVWSADEREARLAPAAGVAVSLPGGGRHAIPSLADCHVCHDGGSTPVLGFAALQLAPDRDPGALHAEAPQPDSLGLTTLLATGRLRRYTGPERPRLAARSAVERAALGYLHANCGGCHRAEGPLAGLGMVLASSVAGDGPSTVATTVGAPSHFSLPGATVRVSAGAAAASTLLARMRSREPLVQMPPLATRVVDEQATELIARWIDQLTPTNH